jgi:hypothetical protein
MPTTARAQYLDLYKTVLVWGMVGAHVVQLLGLRLGAGAAAYSDYINLITFSGFMLAFGLGTGLSRPRRRSLGERVRPALVMLACVYISSLAFVMLVDRRPVTPELLADLLSFRRLFGYSEFLASFFVLYVVIAVARPLLVAIAERPLVLALAIVACLAVTSVTTDQFIPFAGTLIGHRRYASFPLLPYLPWFLMGLRLGRRDGVAGPVEVGLALIASAAFGWVFWRAGYSLPERFPPSIAWIVGPALPLLVYLVAARAIADHLRLPALLLAPGRHVLAALLLSNLIIFSTGRLFFKPARQPLAAVAIAIAALVAVTLWCAAMDAMGRRERRKRTAAA